MMTSKRQYLKKTGRLRQEASIVIHCFAVVAGLLLLVAVWLPAHAAKPPATIFGEYVGFTTKSKSGTALPTKKSDRVRILRSQDSDAKVTITLTFAQGQVCELEGSAVWANDRLTLTADGLDEAKPCQLVLRIKGSVLTLQDSEARCREVYCGTRGAFDGASFRKKP